MFPRDVHLGVGIAGSFRDICHHHCIDQLETNRLLRHGRAYANFEMALGANLCLHSNDSNMQHTNLVRAERARLC